MTPDIHHWVRARAAAWSAGVLDDEQASRFQAHLADCAACRAWCAELQPDPEAPAGDHVPAGLLARWPRAVRELRGLERELVSGHVERCAECRTILERLGHDAAAMRPARTVVLAPRRAAARPVWLVAAAAVVVAVAVMLARRPAPEPALPAPGSPPSPVAATPELSVVRDWPADAIELRGPMRGEGAGVSDAVVPSDRRVTLTTPALEVPPSATIEIVLVAPDGAVVARTRARANEFGARPAFVLDPRGAPLAEGRWELRLAGAGRDSLSVTFRVAPPR